MSADGEIQLQAGLIQAGDEAERCVAIWGMSVGELLWMIDPFVDFRR